MNPYKKLVYALFFASIAFIITYVAFPRPFKNKAQETHFWIEKTFLAKDVKLLFGGDSRTYRGISPEAFTTRYTDKVEAYNYGYSSAGFSEDYLNFLSSKAVKANAVFVFGITPHSFTPNGLLNEDLNAILKTPKSEIYLHTYFGTALETVAPFSVKDILNYINKNEATDRYFQYYEPLGWIKSYLIPENNKLALKSYLKVFNGNKVDEKAIQNFLQWTKNQHHAGHTIVAYRPPSSREIESIEDSLSGLNFESFAAQFEQSGGIWLNFSSDGYRSYDGSHLHYQSAIKFTENLADSIKQRLTAN